MVDAAKESQQRNNEWNLINKNVKQKAFKTGPIYV